MAIDGGSLRLAAPLGQQSESEGRRHRPDDLPFVDPGTTLVEAAAPSSASAGFGRTIREACRGAG
ncbi:MAG TPA: hypothetical protein VF481_00515 [Novosphingobium sp.]